MTALLWVFVALAAAAFWMWRIIKSSGGPDPEEYPVTPDPAIKSDRDFWDPPNPADKAGGGQ